MKVHRYVTASGKNETKEYINKLSQDERTEAFKESYLQVSKEYDLIKEAIQLRKEMNITQNDVSEVTGMPQKVVSRIEKLGHSPTLRNFIKYIDAMGLDINITKKM